MGARSAIAVVAVLAVVGLLTFGLLSKGSARVQIGEPVPDRSLPYLSGGEGEGKIADYRGEWVLANLWASWCEPCREEAPALEEFHRRHGDQVTVLGINVQDNEEDARSFLREFGLTYPELRSVGDERSEAFGATGVPESYLVDPQGNLALPIIGYVDERILNEEVLPIVEGKG